MNGPGMKPNNTKSNGNITPKQRAAIPHLVSCRSWEQGCSAAGIAKSTYHRWSKTEQFKTALEAARSEIIEKALERLRLGLTEAADTLLALLKDESQPWLQIRAAGMILDHYWKAKELGEIETRLRTIETKLFGES